MKCNEQINKKRSVSLCSSFVGDRYHQPLPQPIAGYRSPPTCANSHDPRLVTSISMTDEDSTPKFIELWSTLNKSFIQSVIDSSAGLNSYSGLIYNYLYRESV